MRFNVIIMYEAIALSVYNPIISQYTSQILQNAALKGLTMRI